ncbi:MAG: N-acetylgalactosamine-4-sulfatase [Spirochaetales bacterium]|nr:N-acetylgalactosamine-4-sulfatase [Spirochaetales bacterium]
MSTRPNIVFVLTDDMSWGDLGCGGNHVISTPNIDSFYDESVRFTNYHVGPTCSPTRAGLMSGHYCNSTGVWHTIGGRSLMHPDEWTLPQALKESGYATGMFGKWHLGDSTPYRPHERGFDTAIYHGGGAIGNIPDGWGNDYWNDLYYVNGVEQRFEGYCTDVWFAEAISWIEEHKEEPFFCYIPTNAPHGPFHVEPSYSEPYRDRTPHINRAEFYGMITNIDENFGRLRQLLSRLGLEDNTILIFMTDNGSAGGVDLDPDGFAENGFNGGLRGKKNSEYDGGHRVPFFMRFPNLDRGTLTGGVDINTLCANIDVMPTLLALCGADIPSGFSFHGTSLLPLLAGSSEHALRSWSDRALVTDSQRVAYPIKWRKSAVMKGEWRLVNGRELYDLETDRQQRNDVAAANPDLVEELRNEYHRWWEICSAQYDRICAMDIGGSEPETVLTTHDLRNESCATAWLQMHVRQAKEVRGFWELDVKKSGSYTVELRRWPRGTTHAICAGIDGDDVEWRKDVIHERTQMYTGGDPVRVHTAVLKIADVEESRAVGSDDTEVVFTIELPAGLARLQAWFMGEPGGMAFSPYYIYIQKENE